MTEIVLYANDEVLELVKAPTISSGDVNCVSLTVDFSKEWDGFTKVAVLFNGDFSPQSNYEKVLTNGKCTVPGEVLKGAEPFHIGIKGIKTDATKTTTILKYQVIKGVPTVITEITEDVYQQILAAYANLETIRNEVDVDAKQTAADRAEVEKMVESVAGIDEQVAKVEQLSQQAQESATQAGTSATEAEQAKTQAETAKLVAETAAGMTAEDRTAVNQAKTAVEEAQKAVKADRTAVEEVKQSVEQLGNAIPEATQAGVQAVNQAKQTAVDEIRQTGTAHKTAVEGAGTKAVQDVENVKYTATEAVETAKTGAVQAVQAEGQKQLTSVQQAAQEIVADREQINTNKADISEISMEIPISVSEKTGFYAGANGYVKRSTSNYDTYKPIDIPPNVKIKYNNVVGNPYVAKFLFGNKKELVEGERVKAFCVPNKSNVYNGYMEIPEGYKYLFISVNTNVSGTVVEGDSYSFIKDNGKISRQISRNAVDIENNRKEIEKLKSTQREKILFLPEKYSLVVGDTFELFWEGIILTNNYKNYNIKVSCDVGNAYAKKYMFTPQAKDVGTKTLKIELYNDAEKLVDTGTVNLIIKAKAQNPATVKNVLCVGDSLLVNGVWAAESYRRIAKTGGNPAGDNLTNIKYIGTMLKDGAGYEGNGGWTFASYNTEYKNPSFVWITTTHNKTGDDQHSVYRDALGTEWKIETLETEKLKMICVKGNGNMPTSGTLTWVSGGTNHESIVFSASEIAAGNQFWNEKTDKVDFAEYVKKVNANSIDYCYILLGWNSSTWGKDRTILEAKKFINNLLASFPKCQIALLGLEIPSLNGFGENYGCAWNWYEKAKYVHELDEWYAEIAKYSENVTAVNISGQFDTENNMQTNTRVVNARNKKTETYQTNGVHPDTSGYLQIADAVYRDLTHKLSV